MPTPTTTGSTLTDRVTTNSSRSWRPAVAQTGAKAVNQRMGHTTFETHLDATVVGPPSHCHPTS